MSAGDDTSGRVVILSSGSDDDVRMRSRLAKQLKPWARMHRVDVWHEGLVAVGGALAEIEERLTDADAIVVLLTPDLLDEERLFALAERSLMGEARVVPVHARACLWRQTAFAERTVFPSNNMTIAMLGDADNAWNEVSEQLITIWTDLVKRPSRPRAKPPIPEPTPRAKSDPDATNADAPPLPKTPNNLPARYPFVGRKKDLAAVHERLTKTGTAAIAQRSATVFGLGGVGKTSLALEYAHAHLAEYPGGVYWVRAEGDPVRALIAFAGELRAVAPPDIAAVLNRLQTNNGEEIAAGVRLALQAERRRSLLVLDNVDADWSAHVPGGLVHVLVTTREPERSIGGDGSRVRIDVLERADAIDLANAITDGCATGDEAARDRVVLDHLGALAVAIDMAARAVRRPWMKTWTRYEIELQKESEPKTTSAPRRESEPQAESELRKPGASLLEDPKLFGEAYRRGAFAAIDLSLGRCTDPLARALLESLATLAPERAPMKWAEAGAGLSSDDLSTGRAWETLADGGFVRLDLVEQTVTLHRLVHRRVGRTLPEETRKSRARTMAPVVWEWLKETVDAGRILVVEAYVPHADVLLATLADEEATSAWIGIADGLGGHHQHCGAYAAAHDLALRALDAAERLTPPDELRVAICLSNLATVLRDLGDAADAKPLLERALRIDEQARGKEHPAVAIRLSVLATVLHELGDAVGAKPLLERALRIGEDALGKEHPAVAIRLSVLATVLRDLGDAVGAKPLLERALRIDEQARGKEHPFVATHLSNLALVLQDLGDAAGARPLLERALRINEQARGKEHPEVALCLSNLATVLHNLNDDAGARPLLERALAIAEKRLGAEHPRTRLFRDNLARLVSQGNKT